MQKLQPKKWGRFLGSKLIAYLFFLALAFGFWFLNQMQTPISRTIEIPVSLKNLPPSYSLRNKHFQDTIRLRVRDVGFRHIRYDMNGFTPIVLPLHYTDRNQPYLALNKQSLRDEVIRRLSSTALIQQQSVESYYLALEPRANKEVPVLLNGTIHLADGYTIVKQSFSPNRVTLYGDRSILDTIKFIKTEVFEASNIDEAYSKRLKLLLPNDVYAKDKEASLDLDVEELTQQVYTTQIRRVNVPKGVRLVVLPSSATVRITLPRSRYKDIKDTDFIPTVDYRDIAKLSSDDARDLPVMLHDTPDFIRQVSVSPKNVQFVIEQE